MSKEKGFNERIINTFPFEKNGRIYNLLSIDEYSDKKRTYYVSVVDNEGYKYKSYFNVITDKVYHKNHKRFFYHNPYTKDNIYNFMKLNNICDLKILDDVSSCTATTQMNVEIKGKIFKMSWNDISNSSESLSVDNIDDYIDCVYSKKITKDEVVKIVLQMYEKKGSALLQDDFDGKTTENHVGIRLIEKYFGTLVNMQKELGLPIPSDLRILNDEEVLLEMKNVCEKVYQIEKRKIVTYNDFKKYGSYSDTRRYSKPCEKLTGLSFREYITSLGFELQKAGNGMNHKFDDGEVTTSLYEYEFSNFLRKNGFEYNKTYFRNIYYKKLDDEYKGNMNCDYCIDFNGQLVYIELAGILGYKREIDAYRNNTPLKSKSKEEYRLKLNHKREMFERNNLEYYILLPDEMNEETYKNILKKYLKEVA